MKRNNIMTQKQADKRKQNEVGPNKRPDPEVLPRTEKANRRTFTAAYKQWVVEEAEKCREQPGGIGRLLRREGLYSSHLTTWRRQQEAGQLAGLAPRKRGPKSSAEAEEVSRLRRENAWLSRQLEKAELIIEAQKKLSEILGITLEQETEDES
jgi:transposase-like protein